jgi:hypothetical protein
MAIADGTGFSVRNIVATANTTISPPTSIIARPLLFRFSAISASFHAGFIHSSLEHRKMIQYVKPGRCPNVSMCATPKGTQGLGGWPG